MSYLNIENYERRQAGVEACCKANGFKNLEECKALCDKFGIDPYKIVEETQPICFEDAKWSYVLGCAIALKRNVKTAEEAAIAYNKAADLLKKNGCTKEFRVNYIDSIKPKDYAEKYAMLPISDKLNKLSFK